jgi:hypothetical protein
MSDEQQIESAEAPRQANCAVGAGSALWVTAIILSQRDQYRTTLSQTVSWRSNCTENEARGAAVAFAMKEKPGMCIELVTVTRIELSPNKAL